MRAPAPTPVQHADLLGWVVHRLEVRWRARVERVGLDVEDLAQDVMVRLLRRDLAQVTRLDLYVARATDNMALDALQHAGRRQHEPYLDAVDHEVQVHAEGASDVAVARLVALAAERLGWARGGPQTRALGLMLEGYTTAEAAAAVGTTYSRADWWRRWAKAAWRTS